jgi:membrane associated rhomboid family serine protease
MTKRDSLFDATSRPCEVRIIPFSKSKTPSSMQPYDYTSLYISFFLIPVVGTMIRMPTVDDLRRRHRHRFSFPVEDEFVLRNFVFSPLAWEQGRWWTSISYMFLHADRDHLHANLAGLIPMSYTVSTHFGLLHCFGAFLGGGAVAALAGKEQQEREKVMKYIPSRLPQGVRDWVSSGVSQVWTKYFMGYVGCSAGVSALQGMNVMIWLERLVAFIVHPNKVQFETSMVMAAIPNVLSVLLQYSMELKLLSSGDMPGVDHAGHIAGFCFGVGCYAVSRSISYFSILTWRSQDGR